MAALASHQALTASTQDLLTQAATLDDAALTTMASDLTGFAALLAAQSHLRRLLTETTVAAEAKAALTTKLLSDRVSEPALRLAVGTVGHRWSTGRDLVDGLRRLGRTALFLRAERSGELDEVEDQLFRFGRIVDANVDLSVILDDPSTEPEARVALVQRLLDGKAHPLTVELLSGVARDPGGRAFSHGIAELVEQAAQRRDKLVATVTAAVALSEEEIARLRAALAKIYSREVAVHVMVDPGLGGGMRVRVGDEVIDGSVSGRLDTLRQRLARR